MGVITKPKTWIDGEGVLFNDLNDNFDSVYNEFNGNVDNTNLKADAGIVGTKIATNLSSKHMQGSRWSGLYDNGSSGSTKAIDWSQGDRQKLTLSANCTISFSNPTAGQALTLIVAQDGTGGKSLSFPVAVKWVNAEVPTFSSAANAVDILIFIYDGTNYYTQAAIGFG